MHLQLRSRRYACAHLYHFQSPVEVGLVLDFVQPPLHLLLDVFEGLLVLALPCSKCLPSTSVNRSPSLQVHHFLSCIASIKNCKCSGAGS